MRGHTAHGPCLYHKKPTASCLICICLHPLHICPPLSPSPSPSLSGLNELPADDPLCKLARGLLLASVAKNTIKLPDNVFWPDMASTVLYVRSFYKDLWESVLKSGISEDDNLGAVIIGTPGSECAIL